MKKPYKHTIAGAGPRGQREGVMRIESKPTSLDVAVHAWLAAVQALRDPWAPREMEHIISTMCLPADMSAHDLHRLAREANARAEWVCPGDDPQHVYPKHIVCWSKRNTFGLTWESSAQTTLERTRAGWIVWISYDHAERREAAERALGGPMLPSRCTGYEEVEL